MLHFWYISSSGEASQHFSWFFVDFISMYFLFCLSRKYITYVVFLYEQHRGCCSFYDLKYLSVLWPKWLTPFRNKRRFMLKLMFFPEIRFKIWHLIWGKIMAQFSCPSRFRKYSHFFGEICWHDIILATILQVFAWMLLLSPLSLGQNLKNDQNWHGGQKFVEFRLWWKWHHRIRKIQGVKWCIWFFVSKDL